MTVLEVFIGVLMLSAAAYSFLTSTGYDNFKGITLELDTMYDNTTEMAHAAVEELRSRGKQCSILETGNGYPKLLVDGKRYVLIGKMASAKGFPVQVAQLKPVKE